MNWNPVNNLPLEKGWYLCCYNKEEAKSMYQPIWVLYFDGSYFKNNDALFQKFWSKESHKISHWCLLPELP